MITGFIQKYGLYEISVYELVCVLVETIKSDRIVNECMFRNFLRSSEKGEVIMNRLAANVKDVFGDSFYSIS